MRLALICMSVPRTGPTKIAALSAGEACDQLQYLLGTIEWQEVTSLLGGLHFCTGDEGVRVLALGRPRPVLVTPNEQDRRGDPAVVFCRGFPTLSVSGQRYEGAVVPPPT